jgi:hypothetical protein
MALSDILAALPSLNRDDLEVVVAAASALARGNPGPGAAKLPTRPLPKRASAAAKQRKAKGPAKQVSSYAGIPEYQEYRAANKGLRAFLKKEGSKLSDFLPRIAEEDHESKLNLDDLPPAVSTFYVARQCWFRAKAKLSSEASQGSPEAQEEGVSLPQAEESQWG